MLRFVPAVLSALLATHVVAGSQDTLGLNGLHPFKSRAASAVSSSLRRLDPTGFTKIGDTLFGTPSSNGVDDVEFGSVVDLSSADGTRLIVGSPLHDVPNENGGGVFLYDDNGTHWDLLWSSSDDVATTGAASEQIQHVSLSASGDRVAIRRNDVSPNYAQVFDISSGGVATQVGVDIVGSSTQDGETVTLSADGTRLALSSEGDNLSSGLVEVFEWTGTVWTTIGSFSGTVASGRLGSSTAFSLDGNRIAVSAFKFDDGALAEAGLVQVHEYDGVSWSQLGGDIIGTSAGMQLGYSIDLSGSGSSLLIGAPFSDGSGTLRGTVEVYVYDGSAWVLQGAAIEGDDNDRFGRAVSISDDGSRLAASSYQFSNQKGRVQLFELDTGVWTQLGADIEGEANQNRFGFSVSMTGDGVRLAGGATLSDDDGGFSTGSVRVFDGPALPTSSPSQAPSVAPSLAPSSIPSASPVPSSQPSAPPSSSAPPSAAPTSYLDLNVDQFSWDIFRLDDAVVAFNDASDSEEIKFNYNITRRDNTVVIYESDCLTAVPEAVVAVAKSLTPTSPSHGTLDVALDIKQDAVTSSGVWNDTEVGAGTMSLCIRVDLMLDDDDDDVATSVHFHETKIVLTIDLTQGFTVSGVLDLERSDAGELNQNANLEYNVFACQCDVSLTCLSETLTQGDDVYICLETNATNLVFVGIDSLIFEQGLLTRSPITNGDSDALTAVAYNGDKCSIRTQMTSAFFVEDDPADVLARGVAVMAFTNTGRRLRANVVYRDLPGNEDENQVRQLDDQDDGGSVDFEVVFGLNDSDGSSAAVKKVTTVVFMALGGAFFFV